LSDALESTYEASHHPLSLAATLLGGCLTTVPPSDRLGPVEPTVIGVVAGIDRETGVVTFATGGQRQLPKKLDAWWDMAAGIASGDLLLLGPFPPDVSSEWW
jgi:hypothetical protein